MKTATGWQLAQINVARFRFAKEHPANDDFMRALDPVNAKAEEAPGFVWRLVGEGNDATDLEARADDPRLIVNMSVWQTLEALADFVYRQSDHLAVMRRRREWFEKLDVVTALWWVPEAHQPTVEEGMDKLALLESRGPSPAAFTFREPFPDPAWDSAAPILDECA